ncbi:23S rRNA (uracil(1939)-C(5))-methyltransferase RlmD [Tenuibacillus multivorans]|uniref:23S rRNA (Uracil1939-C5)-methyltransferase n=1 Tax=Tenuibacillus multivorans TaxID=237069 RepID=A0A1H0E051_9BACI|nr:23S rRNA (uracil(1939)-C(5))-methyltransferase RlmD [Tenuibacillus multivorans]GEL76707.1 23S rRNA (uracil-C(5))-methyltransferase RlmCD [Tenuibacillus multivorans]SDN75749.1 23S rRNA (uracil1939-C5)-methyltransferase [Tenuibacillus multivorans]
MAKRTAPVKKNEYINLTFVDLTHEGDGVGKIDGYPIFVPYGLPGEKAKVKVVKVKKNIAFGKLVELIEPSEDRIEPPCEVFYQCGGCQIQHMTYERQLKMKQKQVQDVMHKIAHMSDVPVHPVMVMDDPWSYRNKIQIPVGKRDGRVLTGFYQKRSHQIIDMDTCPVQNEANDHIVREMRGIIEDLGIEPYDEKNHRGVIRHIVVRAGYHTNEIMVVLVTRTKDIPRVKELIVRIRELDSNIKGIIHNVNPKQTNVIMGRNSKTLWGEDVIIDKIGDLEFAISAHSFFQVNPGQTEKLYEQVQKYAELTGSETVIDAYCGIGSISLFLAQHAKKVYGVEVVPQAVDDAKDNAKRNHIENAEFFVGEAEKVMPWWRAQGLQLDVIVVDPPRKGCDEELLKAMIEMKPKRIVYVSCNPSTLARDIKILADGGYEAKEIQPVDMFPQSNHIESVTRLELKL